MATLTQTPQDAGLFALFDLEADPAPSSGIDELQQALGTILIAEEDRSSRPSVPYNAPIENKWTGTFSLFAFPRELRDEIYFHYLYRTRSSYYDRTTSGRWPFPAEDDVVSLLLTCTQAYHEAIEVFHRHNEVEIGSVPRLGGGPEKVLNMFPAAHAKQLQKCHRVYEEYKPDYLWSEPLRHFPGECWHIMIRDAYLLKSHFPKLRLFTAKWRVHAKYFQDQEGFDFEKNNTEEDMVQVWLDWMRFSTRNLKALPPSWLRVELCQLNKRTRIMPDMSKHQQALDKAQALFVSEVAAAAGVDGDPDVLGSKLAVETSKQMFRTEIERRKGIVRDI